MIDGYGPLYSTSANWHSQPTISSLDKLDDVMESHIDYGVDE